MASTPLRDGVRLLVALSGGGDSAGLLALLASALPRPDLALGAVHVHHGLRGAEADRDAALARQIACAIGVPFRLVRLRTKPPKGESVEAWARSVRYAALERARLADAYDFVATAHSLDDQAETVLLRIARGTGLDGLAAILPVAGRVVRPALGLTGAELRRAADDAGLVWAEDSTNADRRFLRNRARLDVLPVLESAFPGFARRLAALARHARLRTAALADAAVAAKPSSALYFPLGTLESLPEGAAREVLREGLRALRGGLSRITERHVAALYALRRAPVGATVALPGPFEGVRERGGVRLRPAPAKGGER